MYSPSRLDAKIDHYAAVFVFQVVAMEHNGLVAGFTEREALEHAAATG
jgi:hypothetical protein